MSRAFLLVPLFIFLIGCNQENTAVSPQITPQQQSTPTVTDQEQMTAGSDVRVKVTIVNAPSRDDVPKDAEGDVPSDLVTSATGETSTASGVKAGYAQAGINVTIPITTGGTTPSNTGSAVSTASASQTPSQSTTLSPVQDVKPEFTSSVPIVVTFPGGAGSASANAAGSGGQMGDPQANPTQTPTLTQLAVPAQYAADAIAFLRDFLRIKSEGGTPVLTSQEAE
jgi:hypothetical protein